AEVPGGRASARRAELLLASRSRGRTGGPTAVRGTRDRVHAVQSARGRLADGEVPAGRASAGGIAHVRASRAVRAVSDGQSLRRARPARGARARARAPHRAPPPLLAAP